MAGKLHKVDRTIIKQTINDAMQFATMALSVKFPFYHSFISSIPRAESKDIPTLGVYFKDTFPILVYNPKWVVNHLKREFGPGALAHEIEHIVRLHVSRTPPSIRNSMDENKKKIWNFAVDMAVNGDLANSGVRIDPSWIHPNRFGYEVGLTAEEYMIKLLKDLKSNNISKELFNGGGGVQFDSHDWRIAESQDGEDGNKKVVIKQGLDGIPNESTLPAIEENLKHKINDIANKHRGNLPNHMRAIVEQVLEPPIIDWKAKLKDIVGNSLSSRRRRTLQKPNRRFQFFGALGKVTRRKRVILVAVDTSGSVDDDTFKMFINEVYHMLDDMTSAYLVQADVQISSITELDDKYLKNNPGVDRCGYGGTSFYAPLRLACRAHDISDFENKDLYDTADQIMSKIRRFDILIYLTDGYGDNPPAFPIRTVWVTSDADPSDYGEILYIK